LRRTGRAGTRGPRCAASGCASVERRSSVPAGLELRETTELEAAVDETVGALGPCCAGAAAMPLGTGRAGVGALAPGEAEPEGASVERRTGSAPRACTAAPCWAAGRGTSPAAPCEGTREEAVVRRRSPGASGPREAL